MNKLKRTKGKIQKIILMTTITTALITSNVFAATKDNTGATVDSILEPLNLLKALFIAGIATIGVMKLVKNISEISDALEQRDTHTLNTALRGAFGGFLMAGVSAVLAFLGFS